MAAHLPRLLLQAGASSAAAVAAVLRRFHPLISARLAAGAHPLGAIAVLTFGAPAAALFAVLHGAGNGILTIAKGTLPLIAPIASSPGLCS